MRTITYQRRFRTIIDRLRTWGVHAPAYAALKTRCGETDLFADTDRPIALAQRQLLQISPQFRLGPDIDGLPATAFQPDLCHLYDVGFEAVDDSWASILVRDFATP
jgi:hypothetical protein